MEVSSFDIQLDSCCSFTQAPDIGHLETQREHETIVGLVPLPGFIWSQVVCLLGVLAHTAAYGNNVQGVGWNLDTNNVGPRGTGTLKQPRPRPYEACSEER